MQFVSIQFARFEWDENKRQQNIKKHGIDFPRAAAALEQPHLEKPSDKNGEARILAICPETHRLIAVVYTMRGEALQDYLSQGGT